jgi:hypothetical protein
MPATQQAFYDEEAPTTQEDSERSGSLNRAMEPPKFWGKLLASGDDTTPADDRCLEKVGLSPD